MSTNSPVANQKKMKTYKIQGEWGGKSAGGCLNYSSWRYNPQLFLSVPEKKPVKIRLAQNGEKLFHIGFYIAKSDGTGRRQLILSRDKIVGKAGFEDAKEVSTTVTLDRSDVPYVVIPCTFNPLEETKFTIYFSSNGTLSLAPLSPSKEWHSVDAEGEWHEKSSGGCRNYPTCKNNPQFLIKAKKPTEVNVILSQTPKSEIDVIGFYLFKTNDPTHKLMKLETAELVAKSEFESSREAITSFKLDGTSMNCIVPCTFDPGHYNHFSLTILSDFPVKLVELKDAQDVSIQGEWSTSEGTAGGCINTPLWRLNPQYFVVVHQPAQVTITLKQLSNDIQYIGFYLLRGDGNRLIIFKQEEVEGKGGFAKEKSVSCDLTLQPRAQPYILIPCTFHPNINLKFHLSIFIHGMDNPKEVINLLPCNYFGCKKTLKGEWKGVLRGGCRNNNTWLSNPQFSLKAETNSTRVTIILTQQESSSPEHSIGLYVVRPKVPNEIIPPDEPGVEILEKSPFKQASEVALECIVQKGYSTIIPCTFESGKDGNFQLTVYSTEEDIELQPAGADKALFSPSNSNPQATPAKNNKILLGSGEWEVDINEVVVHEKIGQGGFGVVYRGEYRGKEVAVKKLFREEMKDSDLMSFCKEVELMSKLKHDKIVGFIGACTEYPNICILTDFCHKGSLATVLKNEPNLDWGYKLKMAIDAAKGMIYLHQFKPPVVHRDLKSLNLLVDKDWNCKVADFGLSKVTTGFSLNSKVGSLNWCAPEILLQSHPYTDKADVYSFGMVLWELITHEAPFLNMHPLQIVRAIDQGDLPPIPKDTHPEFRKLIKDCWATNPKKRPNFEEILTRLNLFLNEEDGANSIMRKKS